MYAIRSYYGTWPCFRFRRPTGCSSARTSSRATAWRDFCDVVLGWDCQDQLYDNVKYTGWHTGYPDAPARVVPESCRPLPFEGNGLFFLAEFRNNFV